jgi:hypothetical protein
MDTHLLILFTYLYIPVKVLKLIFSRSLAKCKAITLVYLLWQFHVGSSGQL